MLVQIKCFLSLLIIFVLLILLYQSSSRIFAVSPSFIRQEVRDGGGINDWTFYDANRKNIRSIDRDLINTGDIVSVDYFSDGKKLDVTFWLSKPFEEAPITHLPIYGIYIDADSNPSTGGSAGVDYRVKIQWNNATKSWQEIIEEVSMLETVKILHQDNNFTGFFKKDDNFPHAINNVSLNSWYLGSNCCYVHFTLDLTSINFPSQYVLTFFINDEFIDAHHNKMFRLDSTRQTRVPSPKFDITTLPQTIELRPGEEKTIEAQINSTSYLEAHVLLAANASKEIELNFIPNEVYVPANGISNSFLKVKALEAADQHPYTSSLIAGIVFPSVGPDNQYMFISKDPDMLATSHLIVTVLPPMTFPEHFSNFWHTYGDALNLIGGGFAGGLSGWFFARIERNKGQKDNNNPKKGSPL
jgi:hypothetical protein